MDEIDGPVASDSSQLIVGDGFRKLSHAFFFALETGADGRDIGNAASRVVATARGRSGTCGGGRRRAS